MPNSLKKLTLVLLLYLAAPKAIAAYNNQEVSEYDLETGVYIHTVTQNGNSKANYSSKSGDYSPNVNLFVFNPKNNTYRHLLDKNYGEITSYIVESAFRQSSEQDDKKSVMIGSYVYLAGVDKVQNNVDIAQRAINPSIIIETYNSTSKDFTVWKSNKLTGSATVLFNYHQPAQWHLDVKNQQIRLVSAGTENNQTRLRIKSYAW